jgi:6-phosphogluconolactonase (cycloisomerase 2 family)
MTTGFPVQLATTPTPGAGPVPVSIDPSGHFLYVGNAYNDTISMFTVNTTSGVLTQLTSSPLTFPGLGPNAITIE